MSNKVELQMTAPVRRGIEEALSYMHGMSGHEDFDEVIRKAASDIGEFSAEYAKGLAEVYIRTKAMNSATTISQQG